MDFGWPPPQVDGPPGALRRPVSRGLPPKPSTPSGAAREASYAGNGTDGDGLTPFGGLSGRPAGYSESEVLSPTELAYRARAPYAGPADRANSAALELMRSHAAAAAPAGGAGPPPANGHASVHFKVRATGGSGRVESRPGPLCSACGLFRSAMPGACSSLQQPGAPAAAWAPQGLDSRAPSAAAAANGGGAFVPSFPAPIPVAAPPAMHTITTQDAMASEGAPAGACWHQLAAAG